MTIGLLLALGLALVGLVYLATKLIAWRSTPVELRGDWWGHFERQFRAYASAVRLDDPTTSGAPPLDDGTGRGHGPRFR